MYMNSFSDLMSDLSIFLPFTWAVLIISDIIMQKCKTLLYTSGIRGLEQTMSNIILSSLLINYTFGPPEPCACFHSVPILCH